MRERARSYGSVAVRRWGGALALVAGGVGLVGWLAPGGLGDPAVLRVTEGVSAAGYRTVVEAMAGTPDWLHRLVELTTDAALLILLALVAGIGWLGRQRDPLLLAGAVLVLVATGAAYALSEASKLVVDQERPCRALAGVEPISHCPEVGDWSFPSNHATIAAALGVGLAMVVPRLARFTLPLAGATALLRVVAGVHYPHDIVAGLTLGGVLATATVLVALDPTVRLLHLLRLAPPTTPGRHR
ncbi:phosphatase PAP2 family protein [Micromonospora sp. NBC_01699]|uniref:phosphatase PAP2 family protein n=1 Tax=Micromonospora sp. NBC_01699 TaxID=2975984 RepID=UPI002E36F407|nr:phosphatase PAP2 family protein [Micromonospora sp. NBC_01699]